MLQYVMDHPVGTLILVAVIAFMFYSFHITSKKDGGNKGGKGGDDSTNTPT